MTTSRIEEVGKWGKEEVQIVPDPFYGYDKLKCGKEANLMLFFDWKCQIS